MFHRSEFRVRTGVVVSAKHPTRGPLYWYYSDESSVGGPDYYGITDQVRHALILDIDWRTGGCFRNHSDHIRRVLADHDEGCDGWTETAGETRDDFHEWLKTAPWLDQPAPPRMEQLVDHGYSYSWEQCHTITDVCSDAQDSFQLALQARLLWMQVESLDRLNFWDESLEIRQQAFKCARSLAINEVFHSCRYGATTPTMLNDTPELAREYLDFFSYWKAVKARSDNSDPALA
jgi:hypothetical protein